MRHDVVPEHQREHDAVRGHPPPAVGAQPQQGQEPPLDAVEMGDRLLRGEAVGPLGLALHQRERDLREGEQTRAKRGPSSATWVRAIAVQRTADGSRRSSSAATGR